MRAQMSLHSMPMVVGVQLTDVSAQHSQRSSVYGSAVMVPMSTHKPWSLRGCRWRRTQRLDVPTQLGKDVCRAWMSQHGTATMCAAVGCLNTARRRCVQRLVVPTRHGSGACRGWLSRHGSAVVRAELRCLDTARQRCVQRLDVSTRRRCVQQLDVSTWHSDDVCSSWVSQHSTATLCAEVGCLDTARQWCVQRLVVSTRHSSADSGDEGLGTVCSTVGLHGGLVTACH